jgi:RimJ/RimL family protein N-acetyltransferase
VELIETERLVLRGFHVDDWQALQELALDWRAAPGPEWDKLPTTESECRGFAEHLAASDRYYAMCPRGVEKLVGLLALNGPDEQGRFDLGHIIHSRYQDDDHDREALAAIVDLIFRDPSVSLIVTHNAEHPPQLAPLRSLGFREGDTAGGELVMGRPQWEGARTGARR